MNILFIGPYRQSDGWGLAARDYIEALVKTNHNISIKPVYLSPNIDNNISNNFKLLESNRFDKIDIVIQNVLPHLMDYYWGCKNIGLCYFETLGWKNNWDLKLNLMDEIWIASKKEKDILLNSNVKTTINIVPIPINTDIKDIDSNFKLPTNDFKFYFIGEYIERKNLDKLVQAFHREFHKNESVKLILKLSKTGFSNQNLLSIIEQEFAKLKNSFGIYKDISEYNNEFVITDRLSYNDIIGLHKECDCFVMPSSGESLCRPLMESVLVGNTAISTSNTGMDDSNPFYDLHVNSYEEPVLCHNKPMNDLYSLKELWQIPSITDLQKKMRFVFENKIESKSDFINKFSYEEVSKTILDII